jgi:microcystin-dependent protein
VDDSRTLIATWLKRKTQLEPIMMNLSKRPGAMRLLGKMKRSLGLSLLEIVGGLAISSMALAGFASMANESAEEMRATMVANYLSEFNAGATRFLNANYNDMADATNAVQFIAPGTWRVFNATQLAQWLPVGFAAASPLGAAPCLVIEGLVREPSGAIVPGTGAVRAFTVARTTAGRTIGQRFLASIGAQSGPNTGGGWVMGVPLGAARSISNSWALTAAERTAISNAGLACNGGGIQDNDLITAMTVQGIGVLPGAVTNSYLYRNEVPGFPELNRMNVHLNMGTFSINNANTVTANVFVGNGIVPIGGVVIWTDAAADGRPANIPANFRLCDGTVVNDSSSPLHGVTLPNLSGRFLVGVGRTGPGETEYSMRQAGGVEREAITLDQMPRHSHGGSRTTSGGEHGHQYRGQWDQIDGDGSGGPPGFVLKDKYHDTEWGGTHSHDLAITPEGGGMPFDKRPPFVAVAYIMRIK